MRLPKLPLAPVINHLTTTFEIMLFLNLNAISSVSNPTGTTPYSVQIKLRNSLGGVAALLCTLLLNGCGSPIGPIPGGNLKGEVMPWPTNWSIAEECENVLLETNPTSPYSVTVWGVGDQQKFYVAAGERNNRWAQYLEKYPEVTLSVDGKLYAAQAQRVQESAEFEQIRQAFVAKYDIDPDPDFKTEGALYRLVAAQ